MIKKIFGLLKSRKILVYLLGGLLTYLLKSGLTWLFTDVLNLSYRYSYIISLSIVIILTFLYNLKLTFRVEGYILGRFLLYAGSVLIFNLIDYGLVVFLTEKLSFHCFRNRNVDGLQIFGF